MVYTPTNWSAITSTADVLNIANNNTSGMFWAGMNFMLFAIMLITLTGVFGWEAGLLTSAFVGLMISLTFVYLGIESFWVTGGFVGIIIAMIAYLMWNSRAEQ